MWPYDAEKTVPLSEKNKALLWGEIKCSEGSAKVELVQRQES